MRRGVSVQERRGELEHIGVVVGRYLVLLEKGRRNGAKPTGAHRWPAGGFAELGREGVQGFVGIGIQRAAKRSGAGPED